MPGSCSARSRTSRQPERPFEPVRLEARRVMLSAAHLQRYREVCRCPDGAELPPAYLHLVAMPMHMQLFVVKNFPVKVLGLIHLRNTIRVLHPVDQRAPLRLTVHFDTMRLTDFGQEYDFTTRYEQNGTLVWEEVSTMFARGNTAPKEGSKRPAIERATAPKRGVDRNAQRRGEHGWRYARVSGDFNPIHLTARTAQMFGFKQAVAHGMWSLGRCLGAAAPHLPSGRIQVDTQFKLPVYLLRKRWHARGTSGRVAYLDVHACAATDCIWPCKSVRYERPADGLVRRHRFASKRAEVDRARRRRARNWNRSCAPACARRIMAACVPGASSCSKVRPARSWATRWRTCRSRRFHSPRTSNSTASGARCCARPTIIVVAAESRRARSRNRADARSPPASRTCSWLRMHLDSARCGRPAPLHTIHKPRDARARRRRSHRRLPVSGHDCTCGNRNASVSRRHRRLADLAAARASSRSSFASSRRALRRSGGSLDRAPFS